MASISIPNPSSGQVSDDSDAESSPGESVSLAVVGKESVSLSVETGVVTGGDDRNPASLAASLAFEFAVLDALMAEARAARSRGELFEFPIVERLRILTLQFTD